MAEAARAFDDQGRRQLFESVPQSTSEPKEDEGPWRKVHATGMPPMMLEIMFRDGRVLIFPYSNLDFIDYRDAGQMKFAFNGLMPSLITLEGRHLSELRSLLGCGMIRSVKESDERDYERPESAPAILKITIEGISRN